MVQPNIVHLPIVTIKEVEDDEKTVSPEKTRRSLEVDEGWNLINTQPKLNFI